MRPFGLLFTLAFLQFTTSFGQGLEDVIVEKYYVADKNDAEASIGRLPVKSVTYRIYLDLKPGYRLQAVYGVEGHPLRISTSTGFYNHSMYGGNIPNIIPDRILHQDIAMLDSWLSMGGASESSMGVLKQEDDTLNTISNKYKPTPLLQSRNRKAGIPVADRDGLLFVTTEVPKVIGFGIDSLITIFDKTGNERKGIVFETENGSWACLNGAVGPLESNRILIAQLTTDGKMSFELNVQIGTPEGGVERFVAKDPKDAERLLKTLNYP